MRFFYLLICLVSFLLFPARLLSQTNYALAFDGVNDYVNLGNKFNYQVFTIEMWVKPGAIQKQYADILDNNHNDTRSFVVQQNSLNINQYYFSCHGTSSSATLYFNLTPNVWQHVAFVASQSQEVVYINGSMVSSQSGININYDGTQTLSLGRWAGDTSRAWNGSMDEVRIWNSALSQSTIQSWMHKELDPTHPDYAGLISYYKLDDGSVSTNIASDSKGNNNGILTGFASTSAAINSTNTSGWVYSTVPLSICLKTICATANENQNLILTAPPGSVITSIDFASYGTPNGSCGNFTLGSCNASDSKYIVDSLALGKNSATILAANSVFGDPCFGTVKRLYVQATASAYNSSPQIDSVNLSGCDSVLYKGITYTSSTISKDTLRGELGCDSLYLITTITVDSLIKATPLNLSAVGDTLFETLSSLYTNYQWYRNDTVITGADKSSYLAAFSGSYRVAYLNSCGPGPKSNPLIFTVKRSQTIAFNSIPTKSFGDSAFALHATASSGLPVSFNVDSGSAKISNDSILTIYGAGNITVTATQIGDSKYLPASVNQTFQVIQALQQITFTTQPDTSASNERYLLYATSSSGLPVGFSVTSGNGAINGDTLFFTGSGIVTVRATQAGNQNYAAAYEEKTFCVGPNQPGKISGFTQTCKGSQTYTVPTQPGVTFTWLVSGGGTLNTNTDSSVSVNWTSLGTYTLTVTASAACDANDLPLRTITVNVINSTIPDSATNLYPPSGTIINNFPFSISWRPGANSELYDVFIWESDSTRPSSPVATNIYQIGYVVFPRVLPHYGTGKSYNWQIVSKNGCAEKESIIQNFTIGNLPDLIATHLNVADSVYSGDSIDITAEIRNVGKMRTSANWQDAFYLSKDSILEDPHLFPGVDQYLGARPNVQSLDTGSAYVTSIRIALPEQIIDTNYIIVKANAFNNQSESNYNNNTGYKAFKILLTTPPDLVVDSLQTPTSTFSGQKINVRFTVRNKGAKTIRDSIWKDAIYLSPNPIFAANEAIKLDQLVHLGKLDNNGFYTVVDTVSIPQYVFGYYYIYVVTDVANDVYEVTNENNNIGSSDRITIFLTPAPDFIVSQVSTSSTATAGESIALNYTVENIGATKPPQYGTKWTDGFFISHDSVLNGTATSIGSLAINPGPAMNHGDNYNRTVNLTVPASFTGRGYIYVYTDYNKDVYEYNSDTNNVGVTSILINNPDLTTSLNSVPDSAMAGSTMDISWMVSNIGTGKVLPVQRTDVIWMSPGPAFNKGLSYYLGSISYNSSLDTGSNITKLLSVNIPDSVSGKRYIFVETDAYNTITESNEGNNVSTAKSVIFSIISLSSATDLFVDSVIVNPSNIKAGDNYMLTYSVSNIGTSDITGKSWVDNIYRSHNVVLDASAALIKTIPENLTLAATNSYQQTISFSSSLNDLNNKDTGYWYYFVTTDANNNVYEYNAESNNTQKSNLLTITHDPYPDLLVTNATGTGLLASGKPTTVTWTVANNAGTTGLSPFWYDAIYFSTDSVLSGDDIFAGTKIIYGPLASNSSYTQKLNITVPNGISGVYYMLLVTDFTQLNRDINRSNNVRMISTNVTSNGTDTTIVHIGLSASPDLTVSSFTAPSVGYSGQPVLAKWTVSNIGDTITTKPTWNEYIYLSTADVLDPSAKLLQIYTRAQPLQKDSSYSDSLLVYLPQGVPGNYYLLFKTDGGNNIYENGGENNNTASSFIFITQPDSCDLTVADISMPAQAMITDTIPVRWRLKNAGQNPATGYLRQGVYLSKDTIWDINDVLVSDNLYQANIAPAGDSVYTQKVILAGIQPDNNYVIVRTDLLNNITESNENNNTAASVSQINISVPVLAIDTLTPALLKNHQELYYKINVQDSLVGGTLLVSLKGDSSNALNEMYISFNAVPSRINHDFMYINPVSGSQDIVIPALFKGSYYILVYGSSSQTLQQNITLLATPIDFAILNVNSNVGGNTGSVTVKIDGAKFDSTITASLYNKNLGTYTAIKMKYVNSGALYATFNLNGAVLGKYDVVLTKSNSDMAMWKDSFTVVAGSGGGTTGGTSGSGLVCNIVPAGDDALLQTNVNHPDQYKGLVAFPMYVQFSNSGNVDIPVPQLILQSLNNAGIGDTPEGALGFDLLNIVLSLFEDNGPDDVLRPGVTLQKRFYSALPLGAPHSLYEYRILQK